MNILTFAARLARRLQEEIPASTLASEAAFESEHVIGPAWELSRDHPEIRVFTHRSKNSKLKCDDRTHCGSQEEDFSKRVRGCPRCWTESKAGSVVDAYMTRSNFDLVAIDRSSQRLAVEVKWLSVSPSRGPNGELQRFIGQCVLATATHAAVIGICGFRGQRNRQFDKHEKRVKARLKKMGVTIITLHARER